MTVLILVPGFPADESDTSCLPSIQNYVEALSRKHDVTVFAFQYPFRKGSYSWKGIAVYSAGGRNRSGFGKIVTWMRILGAIRRLGPANDRIIHSFWVGECAFIGRLVSRRTGWRHVMTIGGQEIRSPGLYSRLLRWSGALSDVVLTGGSDHAAAGAPGILGRTVDAIIPLGIDTWPHPESSVPRDIDVLGVGSLIPLKRFDDFLDVASRLLKDLPHLTFTIAGDGPERTYLARRLSVDGLSGNVRLTGHIPREAVLELMARSKVLLHPSEFESQGYVFLEALASGMYVVCRAVGAPGFSEKVIRCSSTTEMAAAVASVLRSVGTFEPAAVPTAEDSVIAYEDVYRSAQSSLGVTSHRS